MYAVKELQEACTRAGRPMPVNVAFFFEGEEENGSLGSREVMQANLGWFANTRLVVISNTLWVGENRPCLTYGMRGMISLSVEVSAPPWMACTAPASPRNQHPPTLHPLNKKPQHAGAICTTCTSFSTFTCQSA